MEGHLNLDALLQLAASIATIAGAVLAVQRVNKNFDKSRSERDAKILQDAKEAASKVKTELDNEIKSLQKEFESHKREVEKDLEHLREVNEGEIKNLGQKIEELRSELRSQHGQLVGLLGKMIDNID